MKCPHQYGETSMCVGLYNCALHLAGGRESISVRVSLCVKERENDSISVRVSVCVCVCAGLRADPLCLPAELR